MALQMLGLNDGTGPSDRDPVLIRGIYLSFLYLRHLRIRELQVHGWSSTLVSGIRSGWLPRRGLSYYFNSNITLCFVLFSDFFMKSSLSGGGVYLSQQ